MRRTAAALAVLLACAGCGSDASPSSSGTSSSPGPSSAALRTGAPVPPVEGIAAEAVENRTDRAAGGQVQVKVSDTGAEPFSVTSVAIDSPGFEPLPAVPVTASFVPGRRIDLPTPYGAPVCDTAAEPAAARLTVVRPSGAVEELRVPMAAEVLTVVHGRLCASLAVGDLVTVEVVDLVERPESLVGRLVLTRAGDDERPVVATRVEGNVLYSADAPLPLELTAGQREASVELTLTTARCDPHALADVKQPYLMPLSVSVDGGEEIPVDLPLDESQRELLRLLTVRVCTPS
ncbi:hypothetical protein [Blastococcus sp. TF02A-26]|uniref:hypothetical protein n=1 Tax=Blastococcus sp. TF02A-26 TaxID=2250577 RepID=UPI000DEAF7B7|nr:hypothetical protein [Blastococcus sp. TF02A-26]RBY82658.1 hypothetical protein DQ240_18335 [Blastococcus sp. TF02A-26]